jgi:hypothetical protein
MPRESKLDHRIFIAAPAAVVWEAVADLAAVQAYNPMVDKASILPGPREGVGAGRTCTTKQGDVVERIIGWRPPKAIEMELVSSPWPVRSMRWTTELAERADGVDISQQLAYIPKYGVLGSLLDAIAMRRQMDKSITGVFQALKAYCEGKANGDA